MPRAFTLIEIMIVIVILGILAALVVPGMVDVSGEVRETAFISSGQIFAAAAKRYELDRGSYPNASAGVLPDGFGEYIQSMKWESGTPIGGQWQARAPVGGVSAAIGVRYLGADPDNDAAAMQAIDEIVDDGDLTTGSFRQFGAQRYFFVVAE